MSMSPQFLSSRFLRFGKSSESNHIAPNAADTDCSSTALGSPESRSRLVLVVPGVGGVGGGVVGGVFGGVVGGVFGGVVGGVVGGITVLLNSVSSGN